MCFWFAVPHEHRTQSYLHFSRSSSAARGSLVTLLPTNASPQTHREAEAEGKERPKGPPYETPLSPSPNQPTNKCEQRYLATSCHLHCSTQFDEHYTHTLALYLTSTRKQTHSLLPFPLCLLLTSSPPQLEFQRQRLPNTPTAWTTAFRQRAELSQDTPPVTIPRYCVWFHPSALVPWPCRFDGFRHRPGKQTSTNNEEGHSLTRTVRGHRLGAEDWGRQLWLCLQR